MVKPLRLESVAGVGASTTQVYYSRGGLAAQEFLNEGGWFELEERTSGVQRRANTGARPARAPTAREAGALAVVDVRIRRGRFRGERHMTEFTALGTAVRLGPLRAGRERADPARRPERRRLLEAGRVRLLAARPGRRDERRLRRLRLPHEVRTLPALAPLVCQPGVRGLHGRPAQRAPSRDRSPAPRGDAARRDRRPRHRGRARAAGAARRQSDASPSTCSAPPSRRSTAPRRPR